MENSQFVFHLEKLIKAGLVAKTETGYTLTDIGKEYANKIDTDIVRIARPAKVTTILCAVRTKDNEREFLVYKRLKNPFYGCMGFPTEKPKWGETLKETAKRGLKEEANLSGRPELFAIRHYLVYSQQQELLEDKIMHAFMFLGPIGEVKGNIEGDYEWVKERDLKEKVKPQLEEFQEVYEAFIEFDGRVTFKEQKVITSKF
uniref:NUDIX domain-containing protein n=1 Tax=candidate division WWE3 bacterium TaxID=2053526 RepID=A0A7C4TQS0_UNCKA